MKPEHVLQHRPTVLTEAQRAEYFENGYLVLPDYVPIGWVERLRAAMMETIELSRSVTESDSVFILEDGHSAETPRLHRITCPQDRHPAFWGFMVDPVMTAAFSAVSSGVQPGDRHKARLRRNES